MKLDFYNCPAPADINSIQLPPKPEFLKYEPDFELMERMRQQYQRFDNVLIIANGGSVSTFKGYYHAFIEQAQKKVYFLSTTDPDYIYELKKVLSKQDTLAIPISKSGDNTTQVESLMQFADYPMLIITGKTSALRAVGEALKANMALHPPIGGRYTGLTEVALIPAAICNLDARGLFEGARRMYQLYEKDNLAFRAASVFYQLEERGYVDVFLPFYSHNLFAMSNLIVQLCHESFGKGGRGQTYFAHEAPESQHHTNQRFFGGRKNISGFFTTVDNFLHPTQNIFPSAVHSVQIRGRHMADISKIPLEKSMQFEAEATMDDAKINAIPFAHLSISGFTPQEIGEHVAFWQLYAVYASVLRGADPFDQPQVENSKNISFSKRLGFKGLL